MIKRASSPPKIAPTRRAKKDDGTGLSRLELILDELQIVFSLLFVLAFVGLLLTGIACWAMWIWEVV